MNFMRIQNEELLLHYLARKDNRAFRHLYGVYFVALKSIAIRYVKDDQTACDLVQEVFISLLESTHRFISGDEVKYFLYSALKTGVSVILESSRCATGISVNCWIRHLKWVVFGKKC